MLYEGLKEGVATCVICVALLPLHSVDVAEEEEGTKRLLLCLWQKTI